MQQKESVNFFYYSNPIQIKKYQKEQVLNNKKIDSQREVKTKSSELPN